jgi:flavin-dependent dehydrogenase
MKVFYTEAMSKREWRDACARPEGQPLQMWWKAAEDAYKAAGCPEGKLVVRHRVLVGGDAAGVNDGLRDGGSSTIGMVREVGVL